MGILRPVMEKRILLIGKIGGKSEGGAQIRTPTIYFLASGAFGLGPGFCGVNRRPGLSTGGLSAARIKAMILPVWSQDGRELHYTDGDSLYAVPFSSQTGEIGMPRKLFSLGAPQSIIEIDVSPDAERFLVAVGDESQYQSSITVVLAWPEQVE